MKKKIIFILSLSAIIIGAAVIILPIAVGRIIKLKSDDIMNEFYKLTADIVKQNMDKIAEYDFSSIEDINTADLYSNIKNINKDCIIGQIIIKDINLRLPIMKGVTNSNLAAGAATMKEDQKMGEGNYTLAGHYNKNKNVLFGGLMYIKKGSVILITDKSFIYEYIVYDIKVTDDTHSVMLSDKYAIQRGKPIITLMTCYYSSKTGKRYFVLGEFARKFKYDKNLML